MPLIAASTQPLDSKVVRIRGPLGSVNSSNTGFTSGIVPFDFGNAGAGSLGVSAQSVTTFEINGTPSTGSAGMTAMAALKAGVMVEAFGTLTTSSSSSSSLLDGSTDTAASTDQRLDLLGRHDARDRDDRRSHLRGWLDPHDHRRG